MTQPSSIPDLYHHADFVRRLARSLLSDPHSADDLAQETWRVALERGPRDGLGSGWLARVARNLARRGWRTRERRAWRERACARPEVEPPSEAALEREEVLQGVVDAVRALEEPYRRTVLARYYEGLSPGAIARGEGVPLETVHARLRRAHARLRERLGRRGPEWRGSLALLVGVRRAPRLLAGAGLVAALAVGTTLVLRSPSAGAPPPPEPARFLVAAGAAGPSAPAALARAAVAPGRAEPARLSGTVRDQDGRPVAGARVFVGAEADPFDEPAGGDAERAIWDPWIGRIFASDAEGRWSCVLSGPREVLVVADLAPVCDPAGGPGARSVLAPAEEVDFVLQCQPHAQLTVRVREGALAIQDFRVVVHGGATRLEDGSLRYERGYHAVTAHDGSVRLVLPVPEAEGRTQHVELVAPDPGAEGCSRDVTLRAGDEVEVVLVLGARAVVSGQVVDRDGRPVEDALVYFGPESAARGDEPFKPLRPERLVESARTGADGWFLLPGNGPEVTVLHRGHSVVTVESARAARIVLPPAGTLRGRVVDADGRPLAGLALDLDQGGATTTTTDADGRFVFAAVEAGAHAILRSGDDGGSFRPLACVRLAPGEELELDLGPPAEGQLELSGAEAPGSSMGVLCGFGTPFDLALVQREVQRDEGPDGDGRLVAAPRPRPGTYWLATTSGLVGPVTVAAGALSVPVPRGSSVLVVRSARPTSVQVVPSDADAFLRLIAARARARIAAGGEVRFKVEPGSYLLVGEAGAVIARAEVPAEGLELTLE